MPPDQNDQPSDVEITATGPLHDLGYGYSVVDNVTSLTDQVNGSLTQAFGYDLLDRLTDADGGYGDQSYGYDANGNRTQRDNATTQVTQTLTYAAGTNRLATEDGLTVGHDGAGNRVSDEGGARSYAYNDAGRMIQFTDGGVVQADYTYNAAGQRTRKVRHIGGSDYVRQFFYDPAGHLIGEYLDNPDGTYAYIDYVWLGDVPLVQERRDFSSSGTPTGTQTTWLHVDHLNTPRIGTDDTDAIVWRWDSDPFGVGEPDSDPDGDSTDHVVLLRFPGQYADEESGHFYNYFRDYDVAVGRYVESDPIGLAGGLNTYAYVGGKPVIYSDPNGHNPLAAIRGALWIGGRIGAVINYGIEAAMGASLGTLLYYRLNDTALQMEGADHPTHEEENEALGMTGAESCEELKWAISVLKSGIRWRKDDLDPRDARLEVGRLHRHRIELMEIKLEQLEAIYKIKCGEQDCG